MTNAALGGRPAVRLSGAESGGSIRVEGRGLPALAGSGMPARAQRGERCLLEHVCYILGLPRGQVPHRNQSVPGDCMVYLSSGPGWGLQALTVRDARTG